ncbi:YggT family protein [Anaerobacillus sp. CMMVII]|uniref:YggT family protein n=1 Tax=Anaerobacillus sp. CMMVII TaxID=2755588 RepID=UPI0021B712D3|nr:YggT family protein [Anaerobacillus sp. CMMVII]MCT8137803.1 YggT family protein [Anaerobacillus sp. CMMVII]
MLKSTIYINYLINIVIGIAQFFLGFRVILKLFGASSTAPFVQWVYNTSQSLLNPFEGIFPTTVLDGKFVIEFSALFALIIYTLVGYFLTQLIWMVQRGIERK